MFRYLITCLPEDLSITHTSILFPHLRNRGNNESSRRSSCSVNQSTKERLIQRWLPSTFTNSRSWVNIRNQTGQSSTWSSSGNPTPVPSQLSDKVLHGLIHRRPYTGSFTILKWSLTRTDLKITLPRFIKKFYTNLSCSNLTPVPPEVSHGPISR